MTKSALAAAAIVATAVWLAYPRTGSDPAPRAAAGSIGESDLIRATDMAPPLGSGSEASRPASSHPVVNSPARSDATGSGPVPMAAAPDIDVVLPVEDFLESDTADYHDDGPFLDADPAASGDAFPEPAAFLDEGVYLDADMPADAWGEGAVGVQDTGVPLPVD